MTYAVKGIFFACLKIAVAFRQAESHFAGLISWTVVDWSAKNP